MVESVISDVMFPPHVSDSTTITDIVKTVHEGKDEDGESSFTSTKTAPFVAESSAFMERVLGDALADASEAALQSMVAAGKAASSAASEAAAAKAWREDADLLQKKTEMAKVKVKHPGEKKRFSQRSRNQNVADFEQNKVGGLLEWINFDKSRPASTWSRVKIAKMDTKRKHV
jgi:hypothetical protein